MIARACMAWCGGRPRRCLPVAVCAVLLLALGVWLGPPPSLTTFCLMILLFPALLGLVAIRDRATRDVWAGWLGLAGLLLVATCAPLLGPSGVLQTLGVVLLGLELLALRHGRAEDAPGWLVRLPPPPGAIWYLPAGLILAAALVGWWRGPVAPAPGPLLTGCALLLATVLLVDGTPVRCLILAVGLAALGGSAGWSGEAVAAPVALPLAAWFATGALGAAVRPAGAGRLGPLVAWWVLIPGGILLYASDRVTATPLVMGAILVLLALRPLLARAGRKQPPSGPGEPLREVARAAVGLPVAWRLYTRAKLTRDPVYACLAAEERSWGRVLDAGCGSGLTGGLCARRADVTAYTGVDLDRGKLAIARALLAALGRDLDADWRLGVWCLPADLPMTSADTVLALDLLHYWSPERQRDLLTGLAAVLAPGGRLYLREGLADAAGADRVLAGERFTTAIGLDPATGHLHLPTRAQLADRLADAGLVIENEWNTGGANRLLRCRHGTLDGRGEGGGLKAEG